MLSYNICCYFQLQPFPESDVMVYVRSPDRDKTCKFCTELFKAKDVVS